MKREQGAVGVGASSIILIAMTLLLTVFGVLALLSARADKKLTDRTHAAAEAYYLADLEAQRVMAAVDAQIAAGEAVTVDNVLKNGESYQVVVPIDEKRAILVIWNPAKGVDKSYTTNYNVINTGEWDVTNPYDLVNTGG